MNHLQHRKIIAGFFILILLIIPPAISFQPAFAESNIRQVIKIFETYPADVASATFVIDPPLANISKAFVILTVSHVSENDNSDTVKLVRILDKNTLQLVGEDTATGNNAVEFIATIIEFEGDVEVQHLEEEVNNLTGTIENFTIPIAVNITQSMLIPRFFAHNSSETSIGSEEYTRLRILDSTTWEYQVAQAINTEPQTQAVSIVEWNQNDIRVVRDIGTLTSEAGGQDATITPPSSIDPTRTILLFTYDHDEGQTIDEDDAGLQVSLTASGNIFLSRGDAEGNIDFSYQLIEFPADMVKVTNFNTTLANTVLSTTVTVPEIQDFDKTMAMSSSAPYNGFSFGRHDEFNEVAGGIDRISSTFQVVNNTQVTISRDDSTGEVIHGWQLIEWLEEDVTENAQATNTKRQVVKIEGEYTGATVIQEFTISPPLQNVNKTVLFMTTSNDDPDTADVAERMKRWGIKNPTTLQIHGSNDPAVSNLPMNFSAILVEFDSTSPIFVQRDQIQYAQGSLDDEKIMHMSPINETGSNILYNGWTSTSGSGDSTLGMEEFATVRIINGSTWGYEVETVSDSQESVAVVNIVDWGSDDISVQRGQDILTGTSLSVSPIVDVIRNQTILYTTFRTSNNDFTENPDDAGLFAHLDNSSPPNIIFERVDGTDAGLIINWELISFPLKNAFVQHGIHNQTAGTSNSTSTLDRPVANVTTAFAIGTVGTPLGTANGKGSLSTTDSFGEITGKMTLDDSTTVRFERGLSVGSWDVGFQVVEFQNSFCEVCLETTGKIFEPTPPVATDTTIWHQLLEWFEPTNSALEGVIDDLDNNGVKLFDIILNIHNGTYGVDANLTSASEFYEEQYLNSTYTKLDDFTGNITGQIRVNFGVPP